MEILVCARTSVRGGHVEYFACRHRIGHSMRWFSAMMIDFAHEFSVYQELGN